MMIGDILALALAAGLTLGVAIVMILMATVRYGSAMVARDAREAHYEAVRDALAVDTGFRRVNIISDED